MALIPVDESMEPRGLRLRRLLAMEIERIVEDLEVRFEYLIELWGRHRDRGPFLDTVFSRYRTLTLLDLVELSSYTAAAVDLFFRELDEFKLYLGFTQDMPATLSDRYVFMLERLRAYGSQAVDALGGPPPRPVIEFEDAEEADPNALPLVSAPGWPQAGQDQPPLEDESGLSGNDSA